MSECPYCESRRKVKGVIGASVLSMSSCHLVDFMSDRRIAAAIIWQCILAL